MLFHDILRGFSSFTWGNAVMIAVGGILIALAIVKEYEPNLLLPIGFGCILANLGMSADHGVFKVIYDAGIKTELFPLLIFIGVGAMIDFRPLLAMPHMVLFGASGQYGLYGTLNWPLCRASRSNGRHQSCDSVPVEDQPPLCDQHPRPGIDGPIACGGILPI